MKKIISKAIVNGIITIVALSFFTLKTNVKPLYQENITKSLKANEQTTLELEDTNLICCYGATGGNSEFYLDNALLTDLTDYVIHKTLSFSETEGKLKVEEVNLTDDTLNKALCMKIKCNDEWLEVRDLTKFEGYTFESIGDTEFYLWYELSLTSKEEVQNAKGTSIEIVFGIE